MDQEPKSVSVEHPRGAFPGHVDDKGRLKLPVGFQEYLATFGDDRLFVTSTDDRIARIYPLSVWKDNEKALDALALQDPEKADALLMIVNRYGGDSKVDAQGRVTLPTDLRRDLLLEGQEVRLDWSRDAISVYSMAEYESRMMAAKAHAPETLSSAKKLGFK